MRLCLMGAVSLSHCLAVMRQRCMFAFHHCVLFFFSLIIHLSKTAKTKTVFILVTLWNLLECESHEEPEGVSGVLDDIDAVCPFDNHACRRHKRNRILQAWLDAE